jgi:hypothetical protein
MKLFKTLLSIILVFSIPLSAQQQSFSFENEISADINKQIICLAKNLYYESASEPYEGKLAVAQVVINRVNSNRYPSDFCGVIYQRVGSICQFSWVCEKPYAIKSPYAWEECMYIARRALTEETLHREIAKSKAMFFHATYVNASFNNIRVVKKIGNHVFYTKM